MVAITNHATAGITQTTTETTHVVMVTIIIALAIKFRVARRVITNTDAVHKIAAHHLAQSLGQNHRNQNAPTTAFELGSKARSKFFKKTNRLNQSGLVLVYLFLFL